MNGMKFDHGKARWDLLPVEELEEVVEVLTHGANKYDDDNWKYVERPLERYYAAAMRHLITWKKGQSLDNESNKSPLAHAICDLLFLMWFDSQIPRPVATACQKGAK